MIGVLGMTFAARPVLLGLVVVPILVLLYMRRETARARAADAFASPQLAVSALPERPGWRRHVPMVAMGLALVLLIVAAARPRRTVTVPAERAAIMLVTDVSGSMLSTDVKPNRLEAVRRAALRFLERVPSRVNVGAIAFNQRARVLQSPTQDRGLVRNALDGLEASGGTATGVAIQAAVGALGHLPSAIGQRPPAAIVLISDGSSTRGIDPVRAARAAGKLHIPVDTVALGTATGTITVPRPGKAPGSEVRHVPPDPTALAAIAKASGGRTYMAVDSTRLSQVYDHLGSQLGRRRVHREITSTFAGGALALVLLGVLASLTWFGRPL